MSTSQSFCICRPERKPKPLDRASTDGAVSPTASSNSCSGPAISDACQSQCDDSATTENSADKVKVLSEVLRLIATSSQHSLKGLQ